MEHKKVLEQLIHDMVLKGMLECDAMFKLQEDAKKEHMPAINTMAHQVSVYYRLLKDKRNYVEKDFKEAFDASLEQFKYIHDQLFDKLKESMMETETHEMLRSKGHNIDTINKAIKAILNDKM